MTPLVLGFSFAESCVAGGGLLFFGSMLLVAGLCRTAGKPAPVVADLPLQDRYPADHPGYDRLWEAIWDEQFTDDTETAIQEALALAGYDYRLWELENGWAEA